MRNHIWRRLLGASIVLIATRDASAQPIPNPPTFVTSYSGFDTYTTLWGWYSSSFFINQNAVEGDLAGCGATGVQLGATSVDVPSPRLPGTPINVTVGTSLPIFVALRPANFSWTFGYPLVAFYALPCGSGPQHLVQYALHFDAPEASISVDLGCQAPIYNGNNWYLPSVQQTVQYATTGRKSITATSYFCDAGVETGDIAGQTTLAFDVGTVSPTLTVSPTTLNVSTGDTDRFVTTTADPSTASFAPMFTIGSMSNPNSSCSVNPTFSQNGGAGSVNTIVTAAPANCSRIFDNVRAQVGQTVSTNSVKIVVPPQIMVKVIVGEAGGQPGDTDQQAIIVTGRNRFGDSGFPGGTTATWQAVLVPAAYYGANNGTTNGPDQELRNASKVFTGEIGDIIGGAKCYWSPTNSQWSIIQAALQSGTKQFPSGTGVPGCWQNQKRQIVYKASVGLNVSGGNNYSNAPAFVFLRLLPHNNDPAVVQIP